MWVQSHRRNAVGSLLAGIAAFLMFLWTFTGEAFFYFSSEHISGSVVAVSHEWVPRGRGSVMAYVPTAEVSGLGNIKVDTSDDSPVYSIGSVMHLRCARQSTAVCREDSFVELWRGSMIWFLITIAFLCLWWILRGKVHANSLQI